MTTEIQKPEWSEFFDNLSRSLEGWETRVELVTDRMGIQKLSGGLPFHGLTVEDRDGALAITLNVGKESGCHQGHVISEPTKVAFEGTGLGPYGVLDIEDASGTQTLIRFLQPFPFLEDANTEIRTAASGSAGNS